MKRRSFLNSLLRAAAIVALAPQLCFRQPVAKIVAPVDPYQNAMTIVVKLMTEMRPRIDEIIDRDAFVKEWVHKHPAYRYEPEV